ncbi:MAG: DUF1549 domain-containing protein [Acidobacteria bacterium]|nr:DUF1549 domain-containing protein [Acidobacteriota bacterium]
MGKLLILSLVLAGCGLAMQDAPQAQQEAFLYKGQPLTDEHRNYWAFRTPVRSAVPTVQQTEWIKNPIDAFILAALEKQGLQPSPAADKNTLMRRVTFDLTGLPPTPREIEAFVNDRAPDAYQKVVKRLLASPRYGERWAQHWLDVARFGETNGYELDAERDQAWRYRDYVIRSLNEDKPYDRFLLEQIAGDELDPSNFDLRVATYFVRAGPQHVVGGNQDEAVNRQEWLTEAMFGIGNAVMGLTVGCARCHDHKFDPISQADYYRMQAFFAATDNHDFKQPAANEQKDYLTAMMAHKAKLKPILDQLKEIERPYEKQIEDGKRAKLEARYAAALNKPKEERSKEEAEDAKLAERMLDVKYEELLAVLPADVKARRAALRKEMHALELQTPAPLATALGVTDAKPAPAMHLLKGGDPHRPAQIVTPRFPAVLLPPDAPALLWFTPVKAPLKSGEFVSTGRRTALARWLTGKDHPLTARVMMNRLWQHHFGRGIVATPNDFGKNGARPSHPELLDWLATEFAEPSNGKPGWSLKQMHELMVLSNTYQQTSDVAHERARPPQDLDNVLLWRMNRKRLEAETTRDAVLSAAGTFTEKLYGPSVRVPLEPEVYDNIFTEGEPDNLWPVTPDVKQHSRRTIYLLYKRNVRLPLLATYDAPDLMSSCGARSVSIHSLQALTLMNSEFMWEQAQALHQRLIRDVKVEPWRVNWLYRLTLGRAATWQERQWTDAFLQEQQRLGRTKAEAWADLCLAMMNLNEFLYLD